MFVLFKQQCKDWLNKYDTGMCLTCQEFLDDDTSPNVPSVLRPIRQQILYHSWRWKIAREAKQPRQNMSTIALILLHFFLPYQQLFSVKFLGNNKGHYYCFVCPAIFVDMKRETYYSTIKYPKTK